MVLPVFFIFNNLSFDQRFLGILGISVLGTLGIAAVGTILSTISANTRMKEVMLPILQIPLCVPVVIAAVEATSQILTRTIPKSPLGSQFWPGLVLSTLPCPISCSSSSSRNKR
jgi:ABC-type transport system involved in cytochrome c biogenesis permease component